MGEMNHMNTTTTTTNDMEQQQRQRLHQRLDQHMLQCVVHQLPVHPRQWNMVAATCSELRDAVDGGREALQRALCNEHEQTCWRGQWAGGLLVGLAKDRETAEAIRVMVAGALVDCQGEKNYTSLMWAVGRGDVELVGALVGVGAQLDLQNDWGWTALMRASYRGYTEIAVVLINAGAQLDLQNGGGWTPLMVASDLGHTEITVALINAEAQLDLQDDRGETALMNASIGGHTGNTVALINAGAQLDLQNDEGCTASDLASAHGHPEIVQALLPRCVVCGGPSQQRCSGCKQVHYCSKKCQKRHWKSGHNKQCLK